MTSRSMAFTTCVATLLLGTVHRRAPEQKPTTQTASQGDSLTVRNRFDVVLSYRTGTGAIRKVRIARRQWSIPGLTTVPRSPEPGLLVVQLTGGDVTTVIGRERRQPKEDEFWTVLPGTPMRIEVGKEQATLEVLAVTEP
jgi:hypothetical protein